jgi:hypothetical protein
MNGASFRSQVVYRLADGENSYDRIIFLSFMKSTRFQQGASSAAEWKE